MTISRVGVATGTNSATVPAHAVGDIIVIFAFRTASGTAPSLPAGYQSILTKAQGTTGSARIGFKIATATNDTSGTWTNATALVCHVYRSSNYATGGTLFIGVSASSGSTTNTVNYPALTLTHSDGTSWVLGFAGVSNISETISTAPAGMTNQSLETAAASQAAGHDTNGTVTSWSSTNVTTTGTAGTSVSATVELIENQPGTSINNLVQHWSLAYDASVADPEPQDLITCNIDATLAGNGLVVAVSYPSGSTPAISDNKANTWPLSGAAGTVTADDGAGNMALQIFVLAAASTATGTSQITVGFGGSPKQPVKIWITQLYGITGTINGSVHAAGVNTGGIVSAGSFTPSNNNANGGNLILAYIANSAAISGTNPALFSAETNFALNDADSSWVQGQGHPNASEYYLQATAAAVTPRFYLDAGGTDTYNIVAVALALGVTGTLPATGPGQPPWINRVCFFSNTSFPDSWTMQIPGTGNTGFWISNFGTPGVGSVSAVSDNDGISWSLQTNANAAPQAAIRENITAARPNRTLTLTVGTPQGACMIVYYDLKNCATTGTIVASATTADTNLNNISSIASQPNVTPPQANCLTMAFFNNALGPTLGVTSPSGAHFDSPQFSVAKFTATIAATTMTVSATTWGTIEVGAGQGALSGSGVTAGTTIVSGTGPYTIQPSQTVSVATVMLQSMDDSNTITWGCASAHYFNGASLSAQNWTWSIANNATASGNAAAYILAGLPAAAITFVPNGNDALPLRGRAPLDFTEFIPVAPPSAGPVAPPNGWLSPSDDRPTRRISNNTDQALFPIAPPISSFGFGSDQLPLRKTFAADFPGFITAPYPPAETTPSVLWSHPDDNSRTRSALLDAGTLLPLSPSPPILIEGTEAPLPPRRGAVFDQGGLIPSPATTPPTPTPTALWDHPDDNFRDRQRPLDQGVSLSLFQAPSGPAVSPMGWLSQGEQATVRKAPVIDSAPLIIPPASTLAGWIGAEDRIMTGRRPALDAGGVIPPKASAPVSGIAWAGTPGDSVVTRPLTWLLSSTALSPQVVAPPPPVTGRVRIYIYW